MSGASGTVRDNLVAAAMNASKCAGKCATLVLLRQKFEGLYFVIRARQQGHRGKLATRASINRRRMVAIEFGM
jgi:hypothetical protein